MSNISLNTYLNDIASKLIIKDDEKESISKSLDVFKTRMKDYFSKNETVNLQEIKVFGSYQRDTNLPPSIDNKSDVDIMLVMDDDGCTPQTYLDRVRRAIEAKYSTSEIKQSSPTIVLQMQHIKFEVMPSIQESGLYKIKNDGGGWKYTFCASDFVNLSDANKANNYMVKPTIRLIKYWNVNKNNKGISSYQLEQKIVAHYNSPMYQGYDTKQYLLTGLKQLQSISMFDFQRERLDKAIAKVQEAIDDEPKYQTIPYDEIKEVIAEI